MSASEGSKAALIAAGAANVSAEASNSSGQSDTPDQDVIDIEGGAALATAWGKKLREWAGPEWTEFGWTYVVKPAAVGLSTVPGEMVFVVTGLQQVVLSAWSLLNQVRPLPHLVLIHCVDREALRSSDWPVKAGALSMSCWLRCIPICWWC